MFLTTTFTIVKVHCYCPRHKIGNMAQSGDPGGRPLGKRGRCDKDSSQYALHVHPSGLIYTKIFSLCDNLQSGRSQTILYQDSCGDKIEFGKETALHSLNCAHNTIR